MENLTEKAKSLTLQSSGVMIVFIILHMLINTISILAILFQGNDKFGVAEAASFVIYSLAIMIPFIFIIPFVYGGIYGVVFLKINSGEIDINQFISLAKNNYKIFFRISIAKGVLYVLYWAFFPRILAIMIPSDYHVGINIYSYRIWSLLINLFFVFAYPLAIVGFFANQNLKPIRSSFSIVIKNFKKLKVVMLLLILEFAFGFLSTEPIPDTFFSYKKILLPILTTPITFFILIYSYLLITEYFYNNLRFDFTKT